MYNIEYSETASLELYEIAEYIRNESMSEEISAKVVLKIREKIETKLMIFPNSGKVEFISSDGIVYRQIVVNGHYVIYRIEETETENFVLITNVIHDKRDKENIIISD